MLTKKSTTRYEYEYELRTKQKFYLYLYEVCPSIEIIDMLWNLYNLLNDEEVLKFYQNTFRKNDILVSGEKFIEGLQGSMTKEGLTLSEQRKKKLELTTAKSIKIKSV